MLIRGLAPQFPSLAAVLINHFLLDIMASKRSRKSKKAPPRPKRRVTAAEKAAPSSENAGKTARASRRSKSFAAALWYAPGLDAHIKGNRALGKAARTLAERVVLTVAPKTVSGELIQSYRGRLHERDIEDFRPRADAVEGAVRRLKRLGFEVLRRGRFGITIAGHCELVSEVLGVQLIVQARPQRTSVRSTQNFAVSYQAPQAVDLYVAPSDSLTVSSAVSPHIDHFVFTPPPQLFVELSDTPPHCNYFTLDGAAIRRLLNVPEGVSGEGVKVAIVDTGFFKHPFYTSHNFDYRPMASATAPDPEKDRIGHGTAISFNALTVAPRATLLGFKQTEPPQDALEAASDAGADIISASWGWDKEQSFPILEATIRALVREGKIVVFASGNGLQAWPGSMPEVISVGGVFSAQDGTLEASNFASGYLSSLYPGRRVPDIAGLCGQRPAGIYITMPSAPGSILDNNLSGPSFPDRDETEADDGWLCSSGTSSAAPQVAGLIALLLEQARRDRIVLTSERIRDVLQQSAKPVERGSSAQGIPAVGHPNIAVGYGLVDAGNALERIRP